MKRKLLSLLFCLLFAVNGLLVANPSNGTPTRVPFKRLSPRYEKTAHPTNPVEGCADANPKTVLPNDT
jgi:hypothetical protein